uniref:RNase H type-1 domain-containing protein n=1 Tax=Strigamia maritima TaxID=126957 RepID=T1JMK3_STRMM
MSRRGGNYYERSNSRAEVYTDGACARNGQDGASAGIGVYWGPNDS